MGKDAAGRAEIRAIIDAALLAAMSVRMMISGIAGAPKHRLTPNHE